jgi:hypothetical protein
MTDAQTWTALGEFLAVFAAMSGLLLRVVGARSAAFLPKPTACGRR